MMTTDNVTSFRDPRDPPERPEWRDNPQLSLINNEAEQCLLGTLLLKNEAYERVADIVTADDFASPMHGHIFAAIGLLVSRGEKADPITLHKMWQADLTAPPELQAKYLGLLVACVVMIANAPYYAKTIAELARRRAIVVAAEEVIADAVNLTDQERTAAVVIDEHEERLQEIVANTVRQGPRSMESIGREATENISAAYKAGGAVVVDTGLADVDKVVSGMGRGINVIGGRPSMGKTALAGSIMINAAERQGKSCLMFSLDMNNEELMQRLIAGRSGIPTDRQRHGRLEKHEWALLIEAQNYLARLPIFIDDTPRLSVEQMRMRARRHKRRHGLDMIIVDHLQLIRQKGRQESRRTEIGDASSLLKAVAKELEVTVLLLSQLGRDVDRRDDKRPLMSDLKETGDIEQDADTIMLVYREEYYLTRAEPRQRPTETQHAFENRLADWRDALDRCAGQGELFIPKNRFGKEGHARVAWVPERQRFENLAPKYLGGLEP